MKKKQPLKYIEERANPATLTFILYDQIREIAWNDPQQFHDIAVTVYNYNNHFELPKDAKEAKRRSLALQIDIEEVLAFMDSKDFFFIMLPQLAKVMDLTELARVMAEGKYNYE